MRSLGFDFSLIAAATCALCSEPTVTCAFAPQFVGSHSNLSNAFASTSNVGSGFPVFRVPSTKQALEISIPFVIVVSAMIAASKFVSLISTDSERINLLR